jgi:membrane protease subunit HflK
MTVEPEELMRTVVVQQLTRVMGESAVDEILTIGKRELAQKTLVRSQDLLDDLSSGIELLAVEFKEIIPPRHVIRDFQRVVSAAIQSQTMIRDAEAYRARELPRAQSDARSMIMSARADSLRTVANASVRMTKFKTYLPEYGHRSVSLESRLLRETLEELLSGIKKLYLIPASGNKEGPQIRLLLPKDRS